MSDKLRATFHPHFATRGFEADRQTVTAPKDAPKDEPQPEETEYATGGYIEGPPIPCRVERIGTCANGQCLYSINGGLPEHIISGEELMTGDHCKTLCEPEGDQ